MFHLCTLNECTKVYNIVKPNMATMIFKCTGMFMWQGSHFSRDKKFHVFSRLFPDKCNEIPGQFDFEQVFVLIM